MKQKKKISKTYIRNLKSKNHRILEIVSLNFIENTSNSTTRYSTDLEKKQSTGETLKEKNRDIERILEKKTNTEKV